MAVGARMSMLCVVSAAVAGASSPEGVRVLWLSGGSDLLNSNVSSNLGATDSNCYAGLWPAEHFAKRDGEDDGWVCVGGSGGDHFVGHDGGESVKTITMWPTGGLHNAATGLAWTLTNGNEYYVGQGEGEMKSVEFQPGDHLVGDIVLHGNGHGTRFGRIEFKVRRAASGEIEEYKWGDSHSPYYFPADGMVISGFLGGAGSEIDMLGVILREPDCSVVSREITNIECVSPVDGDYLKCSSVWTDAGTTDTAHALCDFCSTSNDGTCTATFKMVETHTTTTSSKSIDQLGGSIKIGDEFSVGLLGTGGKFKEEYTVTYSHTWEESKSSSSSTTNWIVSTCAVDMKAGTKTAFDSLQHMGHMSADIKLTVTMTDKCGGSSTETHDGTVQISNVPITATITECTPYDLPCTELV